MTAVGIVGVVGVVGVGVRGDDDEGSDEDDGEGVGLRALMEAEVLP